MADDSSSNATSPPAPSRFEALKTHVLANRLDAALWLSRVLAIIFTAAYIVPIFG